MRAALCRAGIGRACNWLVSCFVRRRDGMQHCAASKFAGLPTHTLEAPLTVLRPATAANDDDRRLDAAARITSAARQLVRSEDLEEALAVAASAIGEALAGEAVLRVHRDPARPPRQRLRRRPAVGAVAGRPGGPLRAPRHSTGRRQTPAPATAPAASSWSRRASTPRVGCGPASVAAAGPGAAERTVAELLLHSLAQAVDRIVTVDRFRQNEANLERAVESHRLVGQAMGILIERHRIVSEEAFDVLRRASQDHNVKLREVAQRVIETGAEPDDVVGRS